MEQNNVASHKEEEILEKDFKILLSLGCGTFGEVKLACHLPTNTQVAVKILEKNTNSVADISTEVNILQSVEHRNIVRFFHMIDTLMTTYVIMEYVAGEDMESCIRSLGCLQEEEARPILQQVVSAVHFLHQRHIAHRDIKLENILLDGAENAKLCDFGMAIKIIEGQMLEDICGSLLYLAPEILAKKPYEGMAGDMWSLGIVLFVLVTGYFPYVETTLDGMHRLITNTMCPIPYHLSKSCHIVIARLLMVPTWYRITIGQLVQQPWLGDMQEHVPPAIKVILPRVMDIMCTIGYTCEEIISSLKHRQLNNVTATINILKYKLNCGISHEKAKSWLNIIPACPLSLPLLLEKRVCEPTHFHKEGVDERAKGSRSYPMLNRCSCLDIIAWSDNTGSVRIASIADAINTATGCTDSVDILPGSLSSPESVLDRTHTGFENLGFSIEEPFTGSNIPSDQAQVTPTTARSRSFRGWRLTRKRMSHALRTQCCCCCCWPTPSEELEMT